jgi:hypothetical protein
LASAAAAEPHFLAAHRERAARLSNALAMPQFKGKPRCATEQSVLQLLPVSAQGWLRKHFQHVLRAGAA